MYVDPDGRNPIYDLDGNFMGTDDRGLKGEYIIMKKKDFTQGMSYKAAKENSYLGAISDESRQRIWDHHAILVERPDYDGIVTISEGIDWAKEHPNALSNPTPDNALYIDAAKIDFGNLSVKNIRLNEGQKGNVNLLDHVNLLSYNSIISTYALGNTQMKLLNTKRGTVQLFRDEYNWDYHNDFINGRPQGKRDNLIYLERVRARLNDSHGFPIFIYGIGHIKTK